MQQEARNTESHQRTWSDNNLRYKAIHFVSAGSLAPTLEQEDEGKITSEAGLEASNAENVTDGTAKDTENLFFFDSKGEKHTDTGHPDPIIRLDSTEPDDSSEDEVVFTERDPTDSTENHRCLITGAMHIHAASHPRNPSPAVISTDNTCSKPETPVWPPEEAEETDPLADYIANIDNDYHDEMPFGANLDLDAGIDVDKAATQLDLSASSSTGSFIKSPRSPAQNPTQIGLDYSPESSEEDESDLVISGSDDDALEDFVLLEDLVNGYPVSRHGKPSFPSASAFADALESDPYFGFDIMDFDRPSLRKKSKGKKSAPDLVLSGSEFELELQATWQNDRTKKKIRKKEREELRAQGLLGRKAGNPDLAVKYPKEMNMEQFMTELRSFLLSTKSSLPLPPMTKQRRKLIHELANALNLKSQSRGHGPSRFPVLNKTSRTPQHTPKTISAVDELLSGRKFNRRLFKSWGTEAPKLPHAKRGKSGAASYMDGDVVGASAPEIGADNRGRAMLEKMGWSTGTALGAADNKGILQPVAQVVKNSRAGLG
ncbi:uncharacterized protein N7515_008459 [Penicillium bovifimosum]|uniref:Protein SQS1 n=1 Tax=Penicillium bovifimosum TaxID=126998 RepID=A0A9W9GNG4_9EURO|nr:uncharacterized protein N7515_008459 [Penicillium bovifimosum]KAJ5124634.1 hypothetical protein N7515_008459 [Penicillium bovifimosum]